MARLYANECFPLAVVEYLRRLGHDVLTTLEAEQANQAIPDEAVLEFAIACNRAVITINRLHFIRLHKKRQDHEGIIVCKHDTDFLAQAHAIHEVVSMERSLAGMLIRVNRADRRAVMAVALSRLRPKPKRPKK